MHELSSDFIQRPCSTVSTASSELLCLVEGTTAGDPRCEEELLARLRHGLRCILARKLSPDDVDDAVQHILMTVLTNLREGRLQQPATILKYVRTIALRHIACRHQAYMKARQHHALESCDNMTSGSESPEAIAAAAQQRAIASRVLERLPQKQRDILYRFYVLEQSKERIMADMRLTPTQFRLNKSRAKATLVASANGPKLARSGVQGRRRMFTPILAAA